MSRVSNSFFFARNICIIVCMSTRMNRAGALLAVQAWAGGLGWGAGSEAGEEGRAGFVRIPYFGTVRF